jgi:hypothetical protein
MGKPGKTTQASKTTDQASSQQGFMQRLTRTDVTPLNLNYLFDNIRNYTLAATVMIAGIWLFTRGSHILGMPYINWIFGVHITVCGLILCGLNFVHSLRTVARTPGRKWPAYVVFITLLIGSLELVGVALWKLSERLLIPGVAN